MQDNRRGGGHDNGKTPGVQGPNSENIEWIESTMTWLFDPVTGHTSYNILV